MKLQGRDKQRVAVLFGGQSTEHEVSLLSSISVIRAINRQKYDLTLIGIDKQGRWNLCEEHNYLLNADNLSTICLAPTQCYLAVVPGQPKAQLLDITNGRTLPLIDVAFSVLHGANGEDGSVQGLLQVLNIPYASSDVKSSAICMDKDMAKRVLRDAGISVTPSITLLRTSKTAPDFEAIIDQLGMPLFVKPTNQGSSIGVSKVINRAGFEAALLLAFRYNTKVLIEREIIGREIEIGILGNNSLKVSVCGEILTKNKFYDYDTKYFKSTQAVLVTPASVPTLVADALSQIAQKAYLALGCSVMARIDFFLTDRGQILLNEVNTLPGFTSISTYPQLWKASGLDYPDLLDQLIMLALARGS